VDINPITGKPRTMPLPGASLAGGGAHDRRGANIARLPELVTGPFPELPVHLNPSSR
jgi:hypothetical protein